MVTIMVTKRPWTILLPQVNAQEINYITTENNYVTLNLNVLHDLFVTIVITIMVTTKKPHACVLIDSLFGVWYIY